MTLQHVNVTHNYFTQTRDNFSSLQRILYGHDRVIFSDLCNNKWPYSSSFDFIYAGLLSIAFQLDQNKPLLSSSLLSGAGGDLESSFANAEVINLT